MGEVGFSFSLLCLSVLPSFPSLLSGPLPPLLPLLLSLPIYLFKKYLIRVWYSKYSIRLWK